MLEIGIQSAHWYKSTDPTGSFRFIKECGFEAVDFNMDQYINVKKAAAEGIYPTIFDGDTAEVLEFFKPLKEASEETGVIISQMHAPFPVWFNDNPQLNEHMRMVLDKCFAICEYIGCPAIVVHPVLGEDHDSEIAANMALYRSLIPLIKKYTGVKICLENLFQTVAKRVINGRFSIPSELCAAIDTLNAEAGGDFFGCCLDVGHANLTKASLKDFVKQLAHRLTILHIHDNNGEYDQHTIPYACLSVGSTPTCDWDGFVDGLKDIGYTGVLSFETFRIYHVLPASVIPEALRLISAIGREWVSRLKAE